MKSEENGSSGFRDEDVLRFHDFIPVYRPGARAERVGAKF